MPPVMPPEVELEPAEVPLPVVDPALEPALDELELEVLLALEDDVEAAPLEPDVDDARVAVEAAALLELFAVEEAVVAN